MSKELTTYFLSFLLVIGFMNSCTQSTTNKGGLPGVDSPKVIELYYDSIATDSLIISEYTVLKKLFFSDEKDKVWSLYVDADDAMSGFYLNNTSKNGLYTGIPFEVTWDFREYSYNDTRKESRIAKIEKVKLINPGSDLKRRVVKLNTSSNIVNRINAAHAGDSIILESGVYTLSNWSRLVLDADHMVLKGEPGVFIFGHIEMNVLTIDGNDVTIDNIYLSHTNSLDAACGGDVVVVSSSCEKVCIKNCDINGCGVTGINFYGTIDKNMGEYILENNIIHNNSKAALIVNENIYQEATDVPFLLLKNNKIWNNGEAKIDEPYNYKIAFSFGISDTLKNSIENKLLNTSIFHYEDVPDSLLPFFCNDINLKLGYMNPSHFIDSNAKGLLIYERFKPVYFVDSTDIISLNSENAKLGKKILAIYTVPQVLENYYNEGGEDWGYFSSQVCEHFHSSGVNVTHTDSILSFLQLDSLKKEFPKMSGGMGYLFFYNGVWEYIEHDQYDYVISSGNKFFRRIDARRNQNVTTE
ncbi:MAG: hypothetical protein MI922_21015 [Bacteroidales bacterium]|nr:hypothetical protein [Bacteroidales bacterium]